MTPVALHPTHSYTLPAPSLLIDGAAKIRSLWNHFLEGIGCKIRDAFFYPISFPLPLRLQPILNRETTFAASFWDPSYPLDSNYPHQQQIRDSFHVANLSLPVSVDGTLIEAACRVIESNDAAPDAKCHHFVLAMGSLSTIDNDMTTVYPHMAAYLDRRKEDPTLPPARFVLISQYNLTSDKGVHFKPASFDQAGEILKQTLEALSRRFGSIDCLLGYSNGSMMVSAALNRLSSQARPSLLCLERAPSSIEQVSKGYAFGSILHFLAKHTGWSLDLGKELHEYLSKEPKTSCLISCVKQDYYFSGSASLAEHPLVEELEQRGQAKVLMFNPPNQLFHSRAHHNLRADLLNGNYLIRSTNQKGMPGTTLAKTISAYSIQPLSLACA